MPSASAKPRLQSLNPPIEIQPHKTPEQILAERSEVASKKLAERFDLLNQALTLAEKKLKGLKPPSAVWVYYNWFCEDEMRGGPSSCETLGITKINNEWRLAHGNDHDQNDDGPFNITPLSECAVETRVEAASELPRLHTRIIEIKEAFIPQVDKAVAAVVAYCKGASNE